MPTVAQLGARALQRLGVAIVPAADRPVPVPPVPVADLAVRVLHMLGLSPAVLTTATVPQVELAARALRRLGVNPVPQAESAADAATITLPEIAARALRTLGVNPADAGPATGDAPSTASQIALQALIRLGVIAADETPSAADLAMSEQSVRNVQDELAAMRIATWPPDQAPPRAAAALAIMAAAVLAPAFGKPGDAATYQAAREQLRQLALSGAAAQARAEAAALAVHAALAAANQVRWPASAIPLHAAEPYVLLTAHHLALVHGQASDPTAPARAEAALRRLALSGAVGQAQAEAAIAAVHDALAARGLTTWPAHGVPQSVADEYAAMAAAQLAPTTGAPFDPAALAAAEDRVRQVALLRTAWDQAQTTLRAIRAELEGAGLAAWVGDAVPAALAEPLISMAAPRLAPAFGRAPDPAASAAAEARVRRVLLSGPAGQARAEECVRTVHAGLQAAGRTRWTLFDVPDFAEEPYAAMAAFLLAPTPSASAPTQPGGSLGRPPLPVPSRCPRCVRPCRWRRSECRSKPWRCLLRSRPSCAPRSATWCCPPATAGGWRCAWWARTCPPAPIRRRCAYRCSGPAPRRTPSGAAGRCPNLATRRAARCSSPGRSPPLGTAASASACRPSWTGAPPPWRAARCWCCPASRCRRCWTRCRTMPARRS